MKIRNHRKQEWWFFPHENSSIKDKSAHIFKYKSSLMKFLRSNVQGCINGTVRLEGKSFQSSGCIREYFVWYNEYKYNTTKTSFEIVLKQQDFRGRKYISKPMRISKRSKKYFAFSDKVIHLMCNLENEDGSIPKNKAKKLAQLFKKRGFVDFEPTKDDWSYINSHIEDGICFYHWSDRCNFLRTKTILEYFKRKELLT